MKVVGNADRMITRVAVGSGGCSSLYTDAVRLHADVYITGDTKHADVLTAEALGLDASTVSRHVRSLVADGLVDASRDPGDGRATVLSITEPGRQFLAERLRAHRATLQSATAGFTGQERADLVRLLHKLAAALGAAEETA
jgi:predicted ArsR family transcriptional regulator